MNHKGSTAPAAEFRKFAQMIVLLQNRRLTEKEIDAFIREKVRADLGKEKAKRLRPSLN